MGGVENMKFDFSLVTTYLPILSLCFRASSLVGLIYVSKDTLSLPAPTLLMLTACLLFLDAWVNRNNVFDVTCGHLYICGLALMIQHTEVQPCTDAVQIALWLVDFAWCLLSSFEVCCCAWDIRLKIHIIIKILLVQILAIAHVILTCGSSAQVTVVEMLLRVLVYYMLASIVILSGPFMKGLDWNYFKIWVPMICMHFLFAHVYPLIANVFVFTIIHIRVLYLAFKQQDNKESNIENAMNAASSCNNIPNHSSGQLENKRVVDPGQHRELLAMLQAAKAANDNI